MNEERLREALRRNAEQVVAHGGAQAELSRRLGHGRPRSARAVVAAVAGVVAVLAVAVVVLPRHEPTGREAIRRHERALAPGEVLAEVPLPGRATAVTTTWDASAVMAPRLREPAIWVLAGRTLLRLLPGTHEATVTVQVPGGDRLVASAGAVWLADRDGGRLVRVGDDGEVRTARVPGITAVAGTWHEVWVAAGDAVRTVDPQTMALGEPARLGARVTALAATGGHWLAGLANGRVVDLPSGDEVGRAGGRVDALTEVDGTVFALAGDRVVAVEVPGLRRDVPHARGMDRGGTSGPLWVSYDGGLAALDPVTLAVRGARRLAGGPVTAPEASFDGVWVGVGDRLLLLRS